MFDNASNANTDDRQRKQKAAVASACLHALVVFALTAIPTFRAAPSQPLVETETHITHIYYLKQHPPLPPPKPVPDVSPEPSPEPPKPPPGVEPTVGDPQIPRPAVMRQFAPPEREKAVQPAEVLAEQPQLDLHLPELALAVMPSPGLPPVATAPPALPVPLGSPKAENRPPVSSGQIRSPLSAPQARRAPLIGQGRGRGGTGVGELLSIPMSGGESGGAGAGGSKFPPRPSPHTAPSGILCPKPAYTAEAREHNIHGTVVVQAKFTHEGKVEVLGIADGLGFGLDESAAEAATRCTFLPARENGLPVDRVLKVEGSFELAREELTVKRGENEQ